ncbi:MAG TPA: DUF3866 family protein [Bacillota bacterium]
MFTTAKGRVTGIIRETPVLQEIWVQIADHSQPERAYNYPGLYHRVVVGEKVCLNTTAVNLGLGTGGRHFVIPDPQVEEDRSGPGHIMKLRYTPWQFSVLTAEEDTSPYHQCLEESGGLDGTPVVATPLHSMIPGVILGFNHLWNERHPDKKPRIVYVMTDGAALPIALSDLVRDLKEKALLDLTITAGHAFGGDLESVSIPSALITAKTVGKADLIIVALGPGIVGTGTPLGFSGVESSWVIDLTVRLGGTALAVPRISQADPRLRHYGLSHHTRTVLQLASNPAKLALSRLIPPDLQQHILEQLRNSGLLNRDDWYWVNDLSAEELFTAYGIKVKTMGRDIHQDTAFFQTSVAAGFLAAQAHDGDLPSLVKIMG